jgi:pyrroline-5-carboxylate reductase
MARLTIIGGGRMGTALLAGLIANGWAREEECAVVERYETTRRTLAERFPHLQLTEVASPGEAVVIAVKPGDVEQVCRALPPGGFERVLSIAAGVTTPSLEGWLWRGARVIRAMPNTPALLGVGASVIAPGAHATEEDVIWAESVLSAIGVVVRLSERLVDAATGLSGSGPAYVFLVAEALIDAGVLVGLDREIARVLTLQTMLGAAKMLSESGETAEALRAQVTSPGGTTAEGLRILESHAVRSAFAEAVRAATERSKALGAS